MRLALVTDAWAPQVNGVVRTLQTTVARLKARGHDVHVIAPDSFRTMPCPSYPEIRLALGCGREVRRRLEHLLPDAVHIATEGPLGWAARRWCIDDERPFTTSFHTRFPDYLAVRTGLPARWFWPTIRSFHAPAKRIFVATESLATELRQHGLRQTHRWSRGVDLDLFSSARVPVAAMTRLPGPVQLYVGRVAVEKNIEAFLSSNVPGSKVVVGDGPARAALTKAYPDVHFAGPLHGEALAGAYAAADVFVFPSRTDTFGLVMIEALASGAPVAAFPVAGPLDIIGHDGCGQNGSPIGCLDEDLDAAIRGALRASRSACLSEARRYSWDACTDQFFTGLARTDTRFRLAA